MKKVIIALFLITGAFSLNAQGLQQKVDSLLTVLNRQELKPDEQMEVYSQLSQMYINNNPDKVLEYATQGLNLATKEKNKRRMVDFNNSFGRYYFEKGEHELSLKHFNTALDLALEIKNKELEGQAYGNLAVFYSNNGDLKTGIEYYQKAISCFESIGKEDNCVTWLANIGGTYRLLGEFDLSSRYLKKAESIAERINDRNALLKIYPSLGNLYWEQGELDVAMEYGKKALKVAQEEQHKWGEANAYQTLTVVSIDQKQYDDAEKFANECLRVAKELNNRRFILVAWNALSNVYINQGRYKDAEIAAHTVWETDSTNMVIGANALSNLTFAYISMGNKEKARESFLKYVDFKIEAEQKNIRENLMEMEVKYETEKKELRIAALEEKQKLYTWLGITGGMVLLLAFGTLFFRHRMNVQKRKLAEQQHELAEQRVLQLEQEKQLVATQAVLDGETAERSRLARDLHDGLGGMLSVVKLNLKDMKSYSIMENTDVLRFDKALNMLDQSIGELRRVAHHMMPDSLMRYGLKVSLEDFCRAIPGAQFQYFGTDERLDNRLEVMLYRCTYELVNNAVKHADASEINVQLMIEKGIVSLTVHDNGVGFDPETVTYGAGLENIRKRVSAYNGKMHIHTEPGNGTEINIEIELS